MRCKIIGQLSRNNPRLHRYSPPIISYFTFALSPAHHKLTYQPPQSAQDFKTLSEHKLTSSHNNLLCSFLRVSVFVGFHQIVLIKCCICEFFNICFSAKCHRDDTDFVTFQQSGGISNLLYGIVWLFVDNHNKYFLGIRSATCVILKSLEFSPKQYKGGKHRLCLSPFS